MNFIRLILSFPIFLLIHSTSWSNEMEACRLVVQSIAFGDTWRGVPRVYMTGLSGPQISTQPLPFDLCSSNRREAQVLMRIPGGWFPVAFLATIFNPRDPARGPGFAYRVVTYSAFNPKVTSDNFFIHQEPNQHFEQKVDVAFEIPDEQMEASKAFGSALGYISQDRSADTVTLKFNQIFQVDSSAEALGQVSKQYLTTTIRNYHPADLESLKQQVPDDSNAAAAINRLENAWMKFRSAHISKEMRSGRFGDFKEGLYMAEGDSIEGKVRIYTYVISMGRMHYAYSYLIKIQ